MPIDHTVFGVIMWIRNAIAHYNSKMTQVFNITRGTSITMNFFEIVENADSFGSRFLSKVDRLTCAVVYDFTRIGGAI